MKGRRPSALAEGRKPKEAQAQIVEKKGAALDANTGAALPVPVSVSLLPEAEECWHLVTDGQTRFRAEEVPLLESYCVAYAAMRQALGNLAQEGDGTMQITIQTPSGTVRKNPAWQVWCEASDKMRHLSSILGLDTLTAERLNLTRAATASIAADLPAKIRKAAKEALSDG